MEVLSILSEIFRDINKNQKERFKKIHQQVDFLEKALNDLYKTVDEVEKKILTPQLALATELTLSLTNPKDLERIIKNFP